MEKRNNPKNVKFLIVPLIFLSVFILIFSLILLSDKLKLDKRTYFVAGIDYSDLEKLSLVTGINTESLLMSFKTIGIDYIFLQPQTIRNLAEIGEISLIKDSDSSYLISTPNKELLDFLVEFFKKRKLNFGFLGNNQLFLRSYKPILEKVLDEPLYYPRLPSEVLRNLRLKTGYFISEGSNYNFQYYEKFFLNISIQNVLTPVIFKGNHYKKDISPEKMAKLIENKKGIAILNLEFNSSQLQKEILPLLSPKKIFLAHSLKLNENEKYYLPSLYHRWIRAVKERNVKFIIPRLFLLKKDRSKIIDFNREYLKTLFSMLQQRGYHKVQQLKIWEFSQPKKIFKLILLFLIILSVILISWIYFEVIPFIFFAGINLFVFVLLFLLFWLKYKFFVIYSSLYLAILLPTFSSWIIWKRITEFSAILIAFSILILGSFSLHAILFSPTYYLKINLFRGIKISFLLPLFFWLFYFLFSYQRKGNLKQIIFSFFNLSLKIWHLLLVGLGIFIFILYLSRSGNFPLIPVTQTERVIRDILSDLFYVRPRSKEFLIGYPALFLLYLSRNSLLSFRFPKWIEKILILMVTVGFISIVNTYEHIHTPFLISVLRTFNGFLVSLALIGLPLLLLFFKRKYKDLKGEIDGE